MASKNILQKIFDNDCPRCGEGRVFKSYLDMNVECSHCSYLFQRESGYFVMSWFINYILSGFIVMPVFLLLIVLGFSYSVFITTPLLILVLIQPFMIRFSRLLWMNLDYKVEQSKKNKY